MSINSRRFAVYYKSKALGFKVRTQQCYNGPSCAICCKDTDRPTMGDIHVAIAGNGIRKNLTLGQAEKLLADWEKEHVKG